MPLAFPPGMDHAPPHEPDRRPAAGAGRCLRRRLVASSLPAVGRGGVAAVALASPLSPAHAQGAPLDPPVASASVAAATSGKSKTLRPVSLRVNGVRHDLQLEPRVSLLDALRELLALTRTKKGCDRGQCGACTVLVDGRRITSCLTPAVTHEDEEITTIEGLGTPDALHPMQAAFVEHDGFQCGYCTPGQICSAVAMLGEWKAGALSAASFEGPGVGYGMATATYPANRSAADATVRRLTDGSAIVRSVTHDLGTGTYTVLF